MLSCTRKTIMDGGVAHDHAHALPGTSGFHCGYAIDYNLHLAEEIP